MKTAADGRQEFSHKERQTLFAPLCAHAHVALAVSGGGDSLALMHLAAAWAKSTTPKPPRLTVLCVDHGLRCEAADEAAFVQKSAGQLGLPAQILPWCGDKPATGLQQAARIARYALMAAWCRENGASAIVTAHTLEDQVETFFMRLARGSGIEGLASMRAETMSPWPLLRPFLGVSGARLRSYLTAKGLVWCEDPSNSDEKFERIRWRRLLAGGEDSALSLAQIAKSIARLQRADESLQHTAMAAAARLVSHCPPGYAMVEHAGFLAETEEIRLRLLARLAGLYGGREQLKLAGLERVSAWITSGKSRATTFSGVRIVKRRSALVVGREPGRIDTNSVCLAGTGKETPFLWDGRYLLKPCPQLAQSSLFVQSAAATDLPANWRREVRKSGVPAFVVDGLPVICDPSGPVAMPGIAASGLDLACEFRHIAEN